MSNSNYTKKLAFKEKGTSNRIYCRKCKGFVLIKSTYSGRFRNRTGRLFKRIYYGRLFCIRCNSVIEGENGRV